MTSLTETSSRRSRLLFLERKEAKEVLNGEELFWRRGDLKYATLVGGTAQRSGDLLRKRPHAATELFILMGTTRPSDLACKRNGHHSFIMATE